MSSSSLDEKRSASYELKPQTQLKVAAADVDTGAILAAGVHEELEPDEAERLRKKIDRHILPLMCILYWVQFMDKTTLGSSAILGIKEAARLTTDQYNWLGTVFYLSYLIFEVPQNLALQRFPVAKWLSFNIFCWAIALCSHAACKSFAGLVVVRCILGACEGSILAGFLLVTSMFYTRKEQTVRVGYWYLMNGIAQVVSGFISFGTLHIHTEKFEPWQWLMIITGIITFCTAVAFFFLFPDSPTNAWFLTERERAMAVVRIKTNQAGVENKHFKKEQMIEALRDPKTWLFALFAAMTNIPNSLSNQRSLIVKSFGFTVLQTTLLTCIDGAVEIITIAVGVHVAARTNQRAYTAFVWKSPEILATVLITCLSWNNKVGLLCSLYLTGAFPLPDSSSPFLEVEIPFYGTQDKYKPRNRVPWAIIGVAYGGCMLLLLVIRWVLNAENKRRDAEPPSDEYDNVYIERMAADGVVEKIKVDKEFLDLTDRQNREFRYVL
ncbi:Membrane transporter [Mycena kentingensis (nom. inval.)]|nr:Membrane transporter [Mycena kentingensis (nom. inval.)]